MSDLKRIGRVSLGGGVRSGRLWRRSGVLAGLSIVASLWLAASASADVVALTARCGQVLTNRDTYVLQNDVGPCSTDGIIIRNPGQGATLTLDLNGHRILGQPLVTDANGNATGGFGEGAGVRVEGSNGIVVTTTKPGGAIRDFDAGVLLVRNTKRSTTNSKVTNLTLASNVGRQVFGEGGANQSDFSDGIALLGATGNTIQSNTLTDNGARAIGLVDGADNNKITGNTVTGNRGRGIALVSFNNANTIEGNNVSSNLKGDGIALSFNDANNVVQNNTIDSNFGNGFRASVDSDGTVVQNNKVTNNGQNGIAFASSNNTASGNTVTGNGTRGQTSRGNAAGFNISGGFTPDDPRGNNVVKANVVTNNRGNGISITCTRNLDAAPDHPPCVDFNQNNQILENSVHANGGAQAGTQVFGSGFDGGFLVGVYDLLDGNNSVNNAATTPAGNAKPCDNNTWRGNYDGTQTAFPDCTKG